MAQHANRPLSSSLASVLVAAACLGCGRTDPRHGILTTVEQVRRLEPDEAQRGRTVRLSGVVTLQDLVAHRVFLQDRTGAIAIDTSNTRGGSYQGRVLEVEGVTARGDLAPLIVNPRIEDRGAGQRPEPRRISIHDLASGREDDAWVETRGVVHSAVVQHDGALALEVVSGGESYTAVLYSSSGLLFSSIVDATVRVRGVANSVLGARGEVIRSRVLTPTTADITVEEPVPADPYAVAPRDIGSLARMGADEVPIHRVRVRAAVVAQDPGDGLLVRDSTGELRVRPAHMIPLQTGEEIDVLGFLRPGGPTAVLEEASLRRLDVGGHGDTSPGARRRSEEGRAPLATALQVRRLSAQEAKQGHPVRLRAVVTYYDPAWSLLFVQDATGGIFVDLNGHPTLDLRSGQRVEVEGLSDPGSFAPQVVSPRIRVLGPGSLPAAPPSSAEQMFTGRLDAQWIEAEGVVQATRQEPDRFWIDIAAARYRFSVHVPIPADRAALAQLIDARVRVRGATGTLFNERKQLVGVQIYVPDLSHLSVVERGTPDPFSLPVQAVGSLLQFHPEAAGGHRVRMQGVATFQRPEGLFLQDQTGAVLVQGPQETPLQAGDRVDVVGFPAAGGYTPVLRDAIFRKVKAGPPPEAAAVAVADAAAGSHDGHLVRLEAYLLDRIGNSREEVLTLQAGKAVFNALLPVGTGEKGLHSVRPGSLLQLTGVCVVEAESSRGAPVARSFRLLLRSPEDVVVVAGAPWWTLQHALWAGSLMAAAVVAAVVWAALLRRQVRVQTDVIRRGQRELLTSEKMASLGRLSAGIAHEMNTPLATVRAALLEMQKLTDEYDASVGDASVGADDHHEIAGEMRRATALADKAAERAAGFVRGIKSQTRDLGPEDGGRFAAGAVVAEALLLLGHAARDANCTVEFEGGAAGVELEGVPGRLGQVVTNLVTNAIDASAGRGGGPVSVELLADDPGVRLRVRDRGCGIPAEILPRIFEPMFTSKPFGEGTGLGLSIVHDIVTGHFGGEIRVQSEVGQGTTFDVVLPRPGARPRAAGIEVAA